MMLLEKAYDKVARTINLPYPGGPQIDQLATQGQMYMISQGF